MRVWWPPSPGSSRRCRGGGLGRFIDRWTFTVIVQTKLTRFLEFWEVCPGVSSVQRAADEITDQLTSIIMRLMTGIFIHYFHSCELYWASWEAREWNLGMEWRLQVWHRYYIHLWTFWKLHEWVWLQVSSDSGNLQLGSGLGSTAAWPMCSNLLSGELWL